MSQNELRQLGSKTPLRQQVDESHQFGLANLQAFELAQGWLDDCAQNHKCDSSRSRDVADLPTRLLDLGGSDPTKIRLVITSDAVAQGADISRYVALSYCWGHATPFLTTPETLSTRLDGIPILEMPKTMRDAVKVARHLGCGYLWIDALCILQGRSEEAHHDWQHESSMMQSVYGGSFCTIVAASATNSDGGIFFQSQPNKTPFKDEPINNRAWALQEWFLSRRLLVYTKDDLFFICDEAKVSRSGNIESGSTKWHPVYRRRLPREAQQFEARDWLDWRLLVQNFSSRNLTNPDDKLPAIAGLARRFHELRGGKNGRYLAGLWECDLLPSLLWRREDAWGGFLSSPETGVAEWYRAPSWSWAANDGLVCNILARDALKMQNAAEIIQCETEPSTEDLYGPVISGQLVLRGPSKAIKPKFRDGYILHRPVAREVKLGSYDFDDTDENAIEAAQTAEATYLLILCGAPTTNGSSWEVTRGLILISSSMGEDVYTRIGVFTSEAPSNNAYMAWWHTAEQKVFTII